MRRRPWYKRYPSNFISGTLGLSLEEKGAYSIVPDLIYDRGGPIPDDSQAIAGFCNCSVRKWNAIRTRLLQLGKLVATGENLSNPRAEWELRSSEKEAEELAENGAKGRRKAAENRAEAAINNDLAQDRLQHARAFQILDVKKDTPKPPKGLGRARICKGMATRPIRSIPSSRPASGQSAGSGRTTTRFQPSAPIPN